MPAKRPFPMNYRHDPNGPGASHQWRAAFHRRMRPEEARAVVGAETPHTILGIPLTATWEEVRKAHRRLVKQYHPDRQNNATKDAAMFCKVQAAYELLEERYTRTFAR